MPQHRMVPKLHVSAKTTNIIVVDLALELFLYWQNHPTRVRRNHQRDLQCNVLNGTRVYAMTKTITATGQKYAYSGEPK